MEIRILTDADLAALAAHVEYARENNRPLSVAWHGGLMVKAGELIWTPPLGEVK